MNAISHRLRRRLVAAFALFSLVTALCFSAFCLLFVYIIEDSFFERMLDQEAAHQQATWQERRNIAAPLRSFVSVHRSFRTMPPDLAQAMASDRRGTEFAGEEGRHYHLRRVVLAGEVPIWLVAQVSAELVVRPQLSFILGFLAVSTLALVALTLGAGYLLARRATMPLTRLTELVAGALPGQLPQDFSHAFPDNEIGLLARSLDQAMARIAGFIEREQHFTRDASHELRTPLTIIDGAAQLLGRHDLPPQAAEQVQRIRSACVQMTQVVETLLALAREELAGEEAGCDLAQATLVRLLPIVERAVIDHSHLLDGKAVQVIVDIDPAASTPGHAGALAILVGNLVSNAFAHTTRGDVRIRHADGCLEVVDSGPGIGPELSSGLFEAGVKGEASAGHGLGLSIASRLAARCGIALACEGGAHGGTRASLRFASPAG